MSYPTLEEAIEVVQDIQRRLHGMAKLPPFCDDPDYARALERAAYSLDDITRPYLPKV